MLPESRATCGILIKNIRTRNAAAKVVRSKAMTASIPANDITAAARTGVRMDTSEFENERIPLVF